MTAASSLSATRRTVVGKASKRLAARNQIPAVLYGQGHDTLPIALDKHDFEMWATVHGASGMVELQLEGDKHPVHAMIREVQRSNVKGTVLHIDFLSVAMNKPIHATVPVHCVNDPAGVRSGGILTINLHEINIEALPANLPEFIEADVAGLEIGDNLHVSSLVAPKGVTILDDAEMIVASVQAPRLETEETAEETEPEVIGKAETGEE